MSMPATEIPHATGELSQNDAIERLLAREQSEQAPRPRAKDPSPEASEPDDDEVRADPAEADDENAQVEGGEFDEDEAPQTTADPVVKFDDGTEVPMSEVKRGYLRQQDYTRKTQEVAETRKAVEAERGAYLAEKRRVADQLTPLIEQAVAIVDSPDLAHELNELRMTDPGAYAVRVMEMNAKRASLAQLRAQQEALQQSAAEEEARALHAERMQTAKASREFLSNTIPAFKKDFDAEYSKLGKYVLEQGISAEAWDNTVTHPEVLMCWKARQYDIGISKTKATGDKLRKAPQPLRPGAAKPAGHAQAREIREATERAHKSGSVADMIALQARKESARR